METVRRFLAEGFRRMGCWLGGPGSTLVAYAVPIGVFILISAPMFATTLAVQRVVQPAACASCHLGDKLAAAKFTRAGKGVQMPKLASHDGISCRTCHSDAKVIEQALLGTAQVRAQAKAGAGGGVKAVNSQGGQAGQALPADGAPAPGHDVSDSACTGCHNMANYKPKPDVSVRSAHDKHAKIGVGCQECHVKSIHGQLSSDGKQVEFPKPKHEQCMGCHKKNTPVGTWPPTLVRCPTCHTQNLKPPFHDASWLGLPTNHGPGAFQMTPVVCSGCHGYQRIDDSLANKDTSDPRLFARNNYWCSGCHLNNRPPRHSSDWRIVHKTQGIPNTLYCLVCHNTDRPDGNKLATDLEQRAVQRIWCNRCHAPDLGQKHPPAKDWLPVHYQYVKANGPVQGRCFYCHNTNHCLTCHQSKTGKILMEYYREQWRKEGREPPPPPAGIPLGVPPQWDQRFNPRF